MHKLALFPDLNGDQYRREWVYKVDDVHFPQAVIIEAPVVATPEEAAPAFTDADDVALFIDAASAGVNVNPGWGQVVRCYLRRTLRLARF